MVFMYKLFVKISDKTEEFDFPYTEKWDDVYSKICLSLIFKLPANCIFVFKSRDLQFPILNQDRYEIALNYCKNASHQLTIYLETKRIDFSENENNNQIKYDKELCISNTSGFETKVRMEKSSSKSSKVEASNLSTDKVTNDLSPSSYLQLEEFKKEVRSNLANIELVINGLVEQNKFAGKKSHLDLFKENSRKDEIRGFHKESVEIEADENDEDYSLQDIDVGALSPDILFGDEHLHETVVVKTGEKFTKSWTLRNIGKRRWPNNLQLVLINQQADYNSQTNEHSNNWGPSVETIDLPAVKSNDGILIQVNHLALSSSGFYFGKWGVFCEGKQVGSKFLYCLAFSEDDQTFKSFPAEYTPNFHENDEYMKPFYPISSLETRKIGNLGYQNVPASYTHHFTRSNYNYTIPTPANTQHFQYPGNVPENRHFKKAQFPLYTSVKYEPHFLTHTPFSDRKSTSDDYQILSESGFNYFAEFKTQQSKDEDITMKKPEYKHSASIDSNASNLKQTASTYSELDNLSSFPPKSSIIEPEPPTPQNSEVATNSKLESSTSSFVTISKMNEIDKNPKIDENAMSDFEIIPLPPCFDLPETFSVSFMEKEVDPTPSAELSKEEDLKTEIKDLQDQPSSSTEAVSGYSKNNEVTKKLTKIRKKETRVKPSKNDDGIRVKSLPISTNMLDLEDPYSVKEDVHDDPYHAQLKCLAEMGFTKTQLCSRLLKQYEGSIDHVVDVIIASNTSDEDQYFTA